jgi:TRAP-type C4-dicarboxylate transport system permease small subunit
MSDPQMLNSATPANTILNWLANATLAVAGLALIGVAVVEGWQVFARYVLNDSPSWTEPVALLLMSTTMMCGAAIGVRGNRHFGFFILGEMSPPSIRRGLTLFAQSIIALIGVLFVVAGIRLVTESWDFPMAGAPLPQGIVYLPICIGGALIAVFSIERMVARSHAAAQASAQSK